MELLWGRLIKRHKFRVVLFTSAYVVDFIICKTAYRGITLTLQSASALLKNQNTISPNDRIGFNYIIQSIEFKILVLDCILLLKILVSGYESAKKILVVGCILAK